MQCSAVQCSAVRISAVQFSVVYLLRQPDGMVLAVEEGVEVRLEIARIHGVRPVARFGHFVCSAYTDEARGCSTNSVVLH